ncbi:three prime repair exonuclease 2-like [Spodoptera litura]|uniref:Three prime repair exonuclease 2-like n=1 Tax=Spodoptera litura TaxID=69820 RepID=A0A9J7E9I8_SPOLT|nr:three prime repair exonuclease 2-like [Spodoptera litura]
MSRQCAKPIETLVFFDLETTNLINEKNDYPGIVELSMVAVNRAHFLNATPEELPRVQHKLLSCFNPEMEMTEKSVKLSNLTNALLEQQAPFDKNTCEMIMAFIKCLPEPVCLVAHNGFGFHYPVLLYRMKLNEADVNPTLMCTDSLFALYDLYGIGYDIDNEPIGKTKSYFELKRPIFYGLNEKPSKSEFKLDEIYEREVKVNITDCSRSQSQSLKILKIALKKAEKFVDWVDRNHCKLSEVPFAI